MEFIHINHLRKLQKELHQFFFLLMFLFAVCIQDIYKFDFLDVFHIMKCFLGNCLKLQITKMLVFRRVVMDWLNILKCRLFFP